MIPEFVTSVILGLVVFGGLAFHNAIVDRIAALDRDPELIELEDVE